MDFKKISDPERFYQHFFGDQVPFFACFWTAAVFERCVSPFFLDKGGNLPGSDAHLKLTAALEKCGTYLHMEIIKKCKLLSYSIAVWLLGVHFGYAEYPDECILWHHLLGQGDKGYMVPNIYKELSEFQRKFEAKKEKGLLQKEDQERRLVFFWEEEQSTQSYTLTDVVFDTSAMSEDGISINTLFRGGVPFYLSRRLVDFDFEKYVEADEDIKGALCRYLRVVLSKQFLSRVLGEGYVCELFGRCEKEAKVMFNYKLQPELDGRISVMMSIIDRDRGCFGVDNYDPQKEDNKYTKFEVHLKLTWNAAMDAIEKVKLCDKFIVNRPIGRYCKGTVIFEKKR